MKDRKCEWDDGKKLCSTDATHYIGQVIDGKDIRPTYLCDPHLQDFLEGLKARV